MITTSALNFTKPFAPITAIEPREIANLVRDFADRLSRELKPATRKRSRRFYDLSVAIRDGEALS